LGSLAALPGGFTLLPSANTIYSVAAAGWRVDKGDVVLELIAAVRDVG
jgi:hypothetical protein